MELLKRNSEEGQGDKKGVVAELTNHFNDSKNIIDIELNASGHYYNPDKYIIIDGFGTVSFGIEVVGQINECPGDFHTPSITTIDNEKISIIGIDVIKDENQEIIIINEREEMFINGLISNNVSLTI